MGPKNQTQFRHVEPLVIGLFVVLLLAFITALLLRPIPSGPADDQRLDLRVPYPFVLIHGLGDTAERWHDTDVVQHLEKLGLRYGGNLSFRSPDPVDQDSDAVVRPAIPKTKIVNGDFFAIEMADSFQSLDDWSRQIHTGIQAVLRETRAPRVVLVAFSAGGVASRQYLVEFARAHHVARLVTISSPHLGSDLSLFAEARERFKERTQTEQLYRVLNEGLTLLATWTEKDLDKPLVGELRPPTRNRRLRLLNAAPHPEDVEYACVVGSHSVALEALLELRTDVELILDGRVTETTLIANLVTAGSSIVRLLNNRMPEIGDGVVLASSQDLRNVDFFKLRPDLIMEVVHANGVHARILEEHNKVDDGLAGIAQILDVNWNTENDSEIVVDYFDYFGRACEAWIEATSGRRIDAARTGIFLRGDRSIAKAFFPVQESLARSGLRVYFDCPGEDLTAGREIARSQQRVTTSSVVEEEADGIDWNPTPLYLE